MRRSFDGVTTNRRGTDDEDFIRFIRYDCVGFGQRDGTRQRGCAHGVHVRAQPLGDRLPGACW